MPGAAAGPEKLRIRLLLNELTRNQGNGTREGAAEPIIIYAPGEGRIRPGAPMSGSRSCVDADGM